MKSKCFQNQIWFFFRNYYKYGAKVFWINVFLVCVLSPLGAIIGLNVQRNTVNAVMAQESLPKIIIIIIELIVFQCVIGVFLNAVQTCFVDIESQKIKCALTREIYSECLKIDYRNFDNPEFYNCYAWTIKEYGTKCRDAMALIVRLLGAIAGCATLIALFFSVNWIIFIITLLTVVINTILGLQTNKTQYQKREKTILHERKLDYANRVFYQDEHLQDIKISEAGHKIIEFYDSSVDSIMSIIRRFSKKVFALGSLSKCVTYISVGCMYIYLSVQAVYGKIEIGEFVTLISASNILKSYLVIFFDFFQLSKEYNLYATRIRCFFDSSKEIETNRDKIDCKLPVNGGMEITFRNVEFHYGNKERFNLSNLNLNIKSGQKIALVGDNGSGKTTMVKLLLRLYDPNEGVIEINGIDIRKLDTHRYREMVGVCMQEAPVFAFSIKENLSVYSNNDITQSLGISGFDRVMKRRNATMDTLVTREFDDSGIVLSGGERHLMSLARVVGGKFGLIVLDEPTAALDPNAEALLMKHIMSKDNHKTVIVISHRLINIIDADVIYVMENGKVIESGTHAQLLNYKGKYCDMFNKQMKTG